VDLNTYYLGVADLENLELGGFANKFFPTL
jgi:hypothetical protein